MTVDMRLEEVGVSSRDDGEPRRDLGKDLGRADAETFARMTEQHRRELHVHCYRMLGSFQDAEDTVQETFLRAWRRRETFEGRSGGLWTVTCGVSRAAYGVAATPTERPRAAARSALGHVHEA